MPNYSDTEEEVADLDDVVADLDLETIPPEVAEYARTEIGETDELKTRTISELQDMIYGECPFGLISLVMLKYPI